VIRKSEDLPELDLFHANAAEAWQVIVADENGTSPDRRSKVDSGIFFDLFPKSEPLQRKESCRK
jgi:hypothetical protein